VNEPGPGRNRDVPPDASATNASAMYAVSATIAMRQSGERVRDSWLTVRLAARELREFYLSSAEQCIDERTLRWNVAHL
jgi:hypothetical protein